MSATYYPMFEPIIAAMIIIATAILLTIKTFQRHAPKTALDSKKTPYTCGNEFTSDDLLTGENTFYRTLKKTLMLGRLKRLHTGDLTTYLHWMFAAVIILTISLVLL